MIHLISQLDSDLAFTTMPFVKGFEYLLKCTYTYVCNCKKVCAPLTLTLYSYVIHSTCISYMHVIYIFHTMSYVLFISCLFGVYPICPRVMRARSARGQVDKWDTPPNRHHINGLYPFRLAEFKIPLVIDP